MNTLQSNMFKFGTHFFLIQLMLPKHKRPTRQVKQGPARPLLKSVQL